MVEIALLADHAKVIPTLVQWFRAQWPEYHARRSGSGLVRDFQSEANRDGLPLRLVAFAQGELVGTIVLRERPLVTLPECRPGLGGLYVHEPHRGHGLGTDLVRAGMNLAREQGYEVVYATTVAASGILERLRWQMVKAVWHGDEPLGLYRCVL